MLPPPSIGGMPENQETVARDLIEVFGESFQECPYFLDYVTIGSYLSDPNQYRSELRLLEDTMTAELDRRIEEAFRPFGRMSKPRIDFERESLILSWQENMISQERRKMFFRKLLSNALAQFEGENGFDMGVKADVLLGAPKRKFNNELRAGRPFKDMGADRNHGEFSHRIQWYLIGRSGRLKNRVCDIYRDIADRRTANPFGKYREFLWTYLFDRDGADGNAERVPFKAPHVSDFRGPSNLNCALRSGATAAEFPLLSLILGKRYEKRETLNQFDYMAKKLGIPVNQIFDRLDLVVEFGKQGIIVQRGPNGIKYI